MRIEGDFERDGAVCVRGAFSADEIASVAAGIEQVLASPSALAARASFANDGAFIEDFCNWQRIPAFETIARSSCSAKLACDVMKSRMVRLYHDHVLVKEVGTLQETPWHQDEPYYNISGHQCVSMWLPVDSVSHKATLQFVPGSHKGALYLPRTFKDNVARWYPAGTLPDLPGDLDSPERKLCSWALEPGDAVFFHVRTIHKAGGADENNRRRVLSLRFIGDDIRFLKRDWITSPPFHGLDEQLDDGAVMEHQLFPVVYNQSD